METYNKPLMFIVFVIIFILIAINSYRVEELEQNVLTLRTYNEEVWRNFVEQDEKIVALKCELESLKTKH